MLTYYMAVDPGKTTGVAWMTDTATAPSFYTMFLVQASEWFGEFVGDIRTVTDKARLILTVERSSARIPRFVSHRADARKIAESFAKGWRSQFGRGSCDVHFVDPRTWQAATVAGAPGADAKARAAFVFNATYDFPLATEHEIDAALLLRYAMTVYK